MVDLSEGLKSSWIRAAYKEVGQNPTKDFLVHRGNFNYVIQVLSDKILSKILEESSPRRVTDNNFFAKKKVTGKIGKELQLIETKENSGSVQLAARALRMAQARGFDTS